MITLRLTGHHNRQERPGVAICEILDDGKVIGGVYPTDTGVKVISPALGVTASEMAYRIVLDPAPPVAALHVNLLAPAAARAH